MKLRECTIVAYFFIGYTLAYGVHFFSAADKLAAESGYQLVKFFILGSGARAQIRQVQGCGELPS